MFSELKNAIKILLCLGLLVLTLVGYRNWLNSSDTFQIGQIDISGNELLSEDEILDLAKIDASKRIWDVNLKAAEKGIKENPFVSGVTIRRDFPDILKIHIIEKQALALLKSKKKFYAIDDNGLVLPSKPGRLYDMPVIAINYRENLLEGKTIDQPDVNTGLGLLRTIMADRPEMYKEISEVVPGRKQGMVLYTSKKSVPVYLGDTDHTAKIRCLEAVLGELENKLSNIRYIDLRFQGQIILGKRT